MSPRFEIGKLMLMSPDFTIYTCRRSGAIIVAAIGQLEVNIIVQKYICASAPTDWWGGARSPLPKTPPASAHHLPSPGKKSCGRPCVWVRDSPPALPRRCCLHTRATTVENAMTEDLASLHCAAPASTSEGLHEYDGRDID